MRKTRPSRLQFDLYRMPLLFRFLHQRLKAADDLTDIVGHPCCPTDADSERRIPLINPASGERIPECVQIASAPFRRAYRREIRRVEVVRSTPVASVKVNLFHHLTLLLHGPGRVTGK